ncbi:MAG: extracellular solute-binding protein [Clostridiales bacterium]|nr:extracellular solute-binding protein [Clostridiales bacterium]
MKRFISLLMVVAISISMFSGCGSNGDDSSGPVTITIWHDKEEAVANVLSEALAGLAPEINVVLEKKEGLTGALKIVGNDPSSAPDMYFFAHDKIGVYAEMGILEPITSFVSEEMLGSYIGMTLDAATYKEEIYQLPIYYETLLFMYNKNLLSEDEVPKTTEKLYQYMKETSKSGEYGFVEQHSNVYYSVPWIHAFNGRLIDNEGTPLLNSEEIIEALEYHKKFLEFMPGESEYSTVNTLFLEELAHSTINGPWLVPSAREAGIDLGFASMPIVDKTNIPLTPYSGVQGLHVLKVAVDHKHDEIQKVLEAITDPELGIKMAEVSGSAPAISSCYDDERIKNDDMIMAMKETAEAAVPMPNIPEMDVMFVMAGNLLVSVNMKGTDVLEAAETFQKKAIQVIDSMK